MREHQVIVVAGETGSGKTTQLPKMCLELGLQHEGIVGHTQPRRLAARTVAERLAEELDTTIGDDVGYQVRFTSEVSEASAVKLMTDGILLTELRRDPLLRRYSAILIDEAHERSLNIDVILGYLKTILPKRPDLKVIITSATIDPVRFARHFSADPSEPDVPVIEVSGRTFPVEIRHRPLRPDAQTPEEDEFGDQNTGAGSSEERDMIDAVSDAVLELAAEPEGDMLVFFPGEREIRDAADALGEVIRRDRRLVDTEILPLFGRLSMAEQKRVFSPGGRRRIVLATNVAETSLTVPGIKYVIDTGTARISRYSTRTKVQRLPIEPISQASADQRAGRCGRTSDGIAVRLYSEADYDSRPKFTDPEILRTSLASVLLQMSSMGITGTPEELLDFPFLQPPDAKAVNDAVRLLTELGALDTGPGTKGSITQIGRALAQLPVDPRIGRMMVEAGRRACLEEVTVLAAALSIQDPRERPAEHRQQADDLHRRFTDDASDFSALLNLWHHLLTSQRELSGNQFRKMCRREHLNYLRVREWQDLVVQLAEIARSADLGPVARPRRRSQLPVEPAARNDAVHQSLLSGLLSHLGMYSPRTREYQGARGTRFAVFPGSGLFKKNHDWVMAAELVETSRLWARSVARIDPAWVEELAPHLIRRSHSEPRWSAKNGAAVATEKVTLFGLPVVADRQVLYGRIDEEHSRELFIRRALIEGDWTTRHHFDKRNRARFREIDELENRTRRLDLRADDERLFTFFNDRLPEKIVAQRHFDSWWKKQRHETPDLLDLTEDHLLGESAETLDVGGFPEHLDLEGLRLELRYEFNPVAWSSGPGGGADRLGSSADGVTVRVPILFLNQLRRQHLDWLIPGLRTELITELIRAMPKQLRKNFVPAPDVAAQAREKLEEEFIPSEAPFAESLATVLQRLRGVRVDPESLDMAALPDHLRLTLAVISERGDVLDSSQDLKELQLRFSAENREAISRSLAEGTSSAAPEGVRPVAATPSAGPGSLEQSDQPERASGTSQRVSPVPAQREQTTWTFGDLPRQITRSVGGRDVTGHPALAEEPTARRGVHCTIQDSEVDQLRVHRSGVIALLREVLPSPQRYVVAHLSTRERLAFSRSPHGTLDSLVEDCTTAAIDYLVPQLLPFTAEEFEGVARHARAELIEAVLGLTDIVARSLTLASELSSQLDSATSSALKPAVSDMRAQLEVLIHPGFVTATGHGQIRHVPRYLQGMRVRMERLQAGQGLTRDAQDMASIQQLEDEYDAAVEAVPDQLPVPPALAQVTWMLEELRVNLFAQHLGTAQTVSAKRIRRALKQTSL